MLNVLFVFIIILAFAAYFYFKTKQFRTNLPIRKKWYKAKAGIALGIFLVAFGCNTSVVYPSTVGYIITIIFIIVGFMAASNNYKRARHEGKFVQEEYRLNQ